MILYHTIRLTETEVNQTIQFDLETRQETTSIYDVSEVIVELNKQGYFLTAVNEKQYFLTKRVD